MTAALKIAGGIVLLLIVLSGLAITIVPRFLDRIYYRGPVTDHFDGERFFNPDGDEDTIRLPAGGSRLGFFWRYFTGSDGRPAWPKHVDVAQAILPPRVDGDRMLVTWVGHATVLVQTNGLNILTDPVWSDKAGPLGLGPTRVTKPGIAFDNLPRIDLVLISHDHYDHLDLATLRRLEDRDHPQIVTSLGNDSVIAQAGAKAMALDWGEAATLKADGLERIDDHRGAPASWVAGDRAHVIATRGHHWGSRWFTDRNRALWSGFVVQLPHGGNLFFAGDSGWGDGKWPAEAAAHGPIRLALIPIGAFRFTPGQMTSGSHIGPGEAVKVFAGLGAARAIPIHWGTFRLSFEGYETPPRMLDALMRCAGGDPASFAPAAIGEPIEIAPYATPRIPDEGRIAACMAQPAITALP